MWPRTSPTRVAWGTLRSMAMALSTPMRTSACLVAFCALFGCGTSDAPLSSGLVADGQVRFGAGDLGATSDAEMDDSGAIDVLVGDCPGGPGCPCAEPVDCDNAFCMDTRAGKRCAQFCVDACEPGFACVQTSSPGGDLVTVCVDRWLHLCEPCAASSANAVLWTTAAACVSYGAEAGAFCAIPCGEQGDCPAGYGCATATATEGKTGQHCVRQDDSGDGAPATCDCSQQAVARSLSTPCVLKKDDGEGGMISCTGSRVCDAEGLSPCQAPDPKPETCDGVDNDCDGDIDESSCDDNNPCSTDVCDPSAVGEGSDGCSHENLHGAACNADDNVCTEADQCVSGKCIAGKQKGCDDGNPCTVDSCSAVKGCQYTDDSAPCDDGNPCTVGDLCKSGSCSGGKTLACDSGKACVLGECDLSTGKCGFKQLGEGTPCNDNNLCTETDTCLAGSCIGKAAVCDDGNDCTVAAGCSAQSGCSFLFKAGVCDDGNDCSYGEGCLAGQCTGAKPVDCNDGNPCTADSCAPTKGCVHSAKIGGCEDGDPCTEGDTCKGGVCAAGSDVCQCENNADCVKFENGNPCDGTLICDKSAAKPACKVNPVTIIKCDASNDGPCVLNTCSSQSGSGKSVG